MTERRATIQAVVVARGRVAARLLCSAFFARLCAALLCLLLAGCSDPPRNFDAISAYYRYDFTAAREALRGDANLRHDEQTILNNTRLGMAALADGDTTEAEHALGHSFELLSTAGLNKDRTIGAILDHEGVRIWKGEPFEQALTYHYVATLYAVMGDWENARAAAANSLFRLTDFGTDQESTSGHSQRDGRHDDSPKNGYTAVDTNFALGFLMEAIGSALSGAPGGDEQLDAALKIDPKLKSLTEALRKGEYDTLLIVDYGKGPTKISYGEDDSLVRFVPQDGERGPLTVSIGAREIASAHSVCDVNQMAIDLRWNNLDEVRKAKSAIGNVLLYGGGAAAIYGAGHRRGGEVALAGLAAMGVGLLTKAGAKADTRYCEFVPQAIYLVPLKLVKPADLRLEIQSDQHSLLILDNVQPGAPGKPKAAYVRLLGPGSPAPEWLTRRSALYSNDVTGVRPGDFPWILGGRDVSTPDRKALEAYQANGYLLDMTVADLQDLYAAEGILIGSGMENAANTPRNPSFRHVLEGGTGLFTPEPTSVGYKRLMCMRHRPYKPKSELARNAAAAIGVKQEPNHQSEDQETKE